MTGGTYKKRMKPRWQNQTRLVRIQESCRGLGGRAPKSRARLFKKYLPVSYGQFMDSIVEILFENIPESEIESFKSELGTSRNNRKQE